MAYVGNPIDTQNTFQSLVGKRFNGDGSTTAFTLDVAPSSTLDIEVFVGNVRQDPNSAYTLSGTTLTFTGAPPSGTNNIYVVHQAKSVGTIGIPDDTISARTLVTLDNSADHVLIEDATDGELKKALIPAASFAGIDDQSSSNDDQLTITDTAVVINEDSDDVDFRVESNGNANMLFVSGGNDVVGIGAEGDLGVGLHIKSADSSASVDSSSDELVIEGSGSSGMSILSGTSGEGGIKFGDSGDNDAGRIVYDHATDDLFFMASGSEFARFDSSANGFEVGTTVDAGALSGATSGGGFSYELANFLCLARTNNPSLRLNRTTGDGDIMTFASQGSIEGTISISGSTTSYGSFCGSHWSRLADNSKPTILRGTVMESIATMCDWYQVEYESDHLNEDEEKIKVRKSIDLPDGGKVGDNYTYTDNGKDYVGKIIKEDNEQLPMCKISDTEDSKAVYGVFMRWDDDDDGTKGVNDMYLASVGEFLVRIHKDETVAIGDYLQSKGDGTAKKQADDILRASTVGKVTSTTKTITHSDGSYCVPCTLHCG